MKKEAEKLTFVVKSEYMGKLLTLLSFLLLTNHQSTIAQYLYKDILSNKQANAERALLKEKKIKTILVHSFEANGDPSEGFFCEKKINKDYSRIETKAKSYVSGRSILTSEFNQKGLLSKTTDSSELVVTTITYTYNHSDKIETIVSVSKSSDDDFNTSIIEEHHYNYNENGTLVSMNRIKNNKDSMLIQFITDAKGNITDEIEVGNNGGHFYYYYDDKNRLTDIVKYNFILKKMHPEFVFDYNRSGEMIQMVAVEEGADSDYFTWKYTYDNDLRIIEKCFSKEKTLMGYFEYEYK